MAALTACQTTSKMETTEAPATVYSGYFVWDSERPQGDAALQCIQLVFTDREELQDGRLRLTGVSRYITGPDNEINFVDTELIYDPTKHSFELWERNATSDNFVADGRFLGKLKPDALFLDGVWASDSGGESGRLNLRVGADAPCAMAADV
ncbi:MAG: hypothetical protein P1V34_08190 [Alphaproteobacteria bacterium]|nr:hypothetical protein [Alphaproteobacteria bacterium]